MPIKQEANAQLVPFPGYMPIPVNNRFNPLSQPSLRPNYQSALVSQYDPFIVHSPMPSQSQSPVQRSRYHPKSNSHLFVVEPYLEDLNDPAKIAKKFFPPNSHFFPSHPSKSLRFYRDILYETQSVDIKPIKDKETDATIFHSLYIRQVIKPEHWSKNAYDQLPLQSGLTYNYGDYIDAWYTVLFHQHPDFSHSWFINFDAKFKPYFPCWFLQWWNIIGPCWEIIPESLRPTINYFSQKHQLTKQEKLFPMLLHFYAKYRVPWILKWSYQINWDTRILSRHYVVKWWDKVIIGKIINEVNANYPPIQMPTSSSNPVKEASPSSSNASLKGKSKKELTELAQQLLAQVSQMNDEDDDDASPKSESSSSQMPSQQFSQKPKPRWSDYVPDSQDPYDLNED
ncbi:hypothetical protein ACE6H2_010647 [Prunus campanulata]